MRARGRPIPVGPAGPGSGGRSSGGDPRPLLYAVACGSPAARYIGRLVALAHGAGWQVAVVATPSGRAFIDEPALAAQTGYPVRCEYHQPGDPLRSRRADAIVVAPATVNTVGKLANGIADTLALGLVVEGHGLGVPVVVVPFTNSAMAAHPAFRENLRRLRSWGVRVMFGDDVLAMPAPGTGADHAARFPWWMPLKALGPPAAAAGPSPASWPLPVAPGWALHPGPAPPIAPRGAPAIVRGR